MIKQLTAPPNYDDMGNAIASAKIIGLILAINFIIVTAPHTLKTPPFLLRCKY